MAGTDCMSSKDLLILTESEKRRRISDDLQREKQKLEEMIIDVSKNVGYNMGEDKRILIQSNIIDKLIVDEMMLGELREKLENMNLNK